MMTSVTITSSSNSTAPILYSCTETTNIVSDFGQNKVAIKRCGLQPPDPCKKRRKQSTPIRIFASELAAEPVVPNYTDTAVVDASLNGKANLPQTTATECPVCQLSLDNADQIQAHLAREHPPIEWQQGYPQMFTQQLPQFNHPTNIRIFNPDAYCDLCNKEFCNKYFLKTHKANKHGIYSDPAAPNTDSPSFCNKFSIVPSEQPIIKIEPLSAYDLSPAAATAQSPMHTNAAQSTNGCSSTNSESDKQIDTVADESNIQNESTSFKSDQDSGYYVPKMSPESCKEIDNRLRRFGVMNPKAFCEICCKEYCNKYFLRTHKMKRHGIFDADDQQTSPLNLIMAEGVDERRSRSPPEAACDSCGIKFQNASLAQLHNVRVHSDTSTTSEDLQKLQSMILQLNDLDMVQHKTQCTLCQKEFENRYLLHVHMLSEHMSSEAQGEPENASNNNSTMCDLCGKDVENLTELKKHIAMMHQNIEERTSSAVAAPTSSYCEICNKELCNKYFMKTHMQRMHGIEIENGAQIGGVVCDICNKELCSKYFLRVHKHNTHGIVEYANSTLPNVPPQSVRKEEASSETPDALKPADLADLSHRYFTHFTEVCTICSRRFRSTKWLKAHLLSDHGQAGAEKWSELEQQLHQTIAHHSKTAPAPEAMLKIPNNGAASAPDLQGIQNVLLSSMFNADENQSKGYQCSMCSFSTLLLPLLFVHERSVHHHQEVDDTQVSKAPPPDLTSRLQAVAKRAQMPASYALPQEDRLSPSGYLMQAFLLEEDHTPAPQRVVPAVVFLPVFQKQIAPLTITFTLTPA